MAYAFCAPIMAQDKTNAAPSVRASEQVKVESKYDKAKDETTIAFTQLEIARSADRQVFLSVSANYPGQKPKQPEDIIVILSVASPQGYKFPDVLALQGTADGKKLPEVLMLNLDKRRMGEDYLETLGTRMRYELFKRLTQAKTVELRLPGLTLQLTEAQLTKLREVEALLHS